MAGLRREIKHSDDASPSVRKRVKARASRWMSEWRGSGSVSSADISHLQDESGIVTEPSASPLVAERNESPSASNPTVTVVDSATPPDLCIPNTVAPDDNEAVITDSKSLWDTAYEALREEKPEVVGAYEELLSKVLPCMKNTSSTKELEDMLSETSSSLANSDTGTRKPEAQNPITRQRMMEDIINLGQERVDEKRVAFKIGQQEFMLRDQMHFIVTGIQLGSVWINEAVKASPLASVAWAGVCLLLPLLTNPSEIQKVNEEGLAYVSQKIRYYTAMEPLFLSGQDVAVKRVYTDRLVELYQAITDFKAQTVLRFFRRRFSNLVRDVVKWDPWEEMLKRVKDLGGNLETESLQISALLNTAALGGLARWTKETDEDKCLQSLRHRRQDYVSYKTRLEQRVPDTCSWVLNHPNYQSWLEADSGPLLISADPGCGKSVLAKYLIDSSFGFRAPKETAICYFFFKDGDQDTLAAAFCALVHQLLCLRPQLMPHAIEKYKQEGEALSTNVTALWEILKTITADPAAGAVIIVLDALDECRQDEQNMATLSRVIRTHFEQRSRHLKILMTSRPYQSTVQNIQRLEKSFANIRINGEDYSETIRHDIDLVIEHQVDRMSKLNDDLRVHLKQRLSGIEHRTYLWLHHFLPYLENTTVRGTTRGLDQAIQNPLVTLEIAYEKILERSDNIGETRKALLILLAAYRPLTLREMQVLLSLSFDTASLADLDLEPDEMFKVRLRELCGLFITVHDDKIHFLHQTAREFLLPKSATWRGPTSTVVWAYKFSIYEAHTTLVESCMVYLDLFDQAVDKGKEYDISAYAADTWVSHFREAGIPDGAPYVRYALKLYDLDPEKGLSGLVGPITLHFQAQFRTDYLSVVDSGFQDLSMASTFGDRAVAQLLLNKDSICIDSKDVFGQTLLLWAVSNGREDVIKLLLDTGKINVNLRDHCGRTSLSQATFNENEAIVKTLLNTSKIDVNIPNNDGRTPLIIAISKSNEAIVKMLLDMSKIDVNILSNDDWTPLIMAISKGNDAIVKMLLNTSKINVDMQRNDGWSPLYMAAYNGNEAVVRLLLASNADINLKDNDGWTALFIAAQNGHEAVVKLLLTSNASIDSKNDDGWTALLIATQFGREAVVELLLASNADINLKNDNGLTALFIAAEDGDNAVVKLLLTSNADVNLKDNDGWTALLIAAQNGHEAIVELLLTSTADVATKSNEGETALFIAAKIGHEAVVRLLLASNADVTSKDNNGWTALSIAAKYGHEAVVKLLLANNADVATKTNRGETALEIAAQNGREAVVRLLQEY